MDINSVNDLPIFGFLHIATQGDWKNIVAEQVGLLQQSGLYARTTRLFTGVIGPHAAAFSSPVEKIEVIHRSACFEEFEFPTLAYLQQFCHSNTCLVYYIHTKGAFRNCPSVHDWRRYMQYFVIERYQDCIALLRTHDICGVNWRQSPWPHFSGNFWWATSDYIKRLIPLDSMPPITGKDQGHRHQCERWIGSGAEVQQAVLHLSKIDHYASRYPRNLYADPKSTAPVSLIDSLPLLDANDAAPDIFRSQRVAMIFDNTVRPDTTGFYCLRACEKIAHVSHIHPSALAKLRPGDFNLYLYIDDGLDYPLRSDLHPSAIWAINTPIQPERLIRRATDIDHVFAAQRDGVGLLRQHGINCATWLPLACDPDIHRQHRLAKQWDTCFAADLNSKKRQELAALIQNRIPKCFVGQRFCHEMAMTYSASRTVLNLSIQNDVNMRIFEALGCGSLLITNDLTENGLSELFVFNKHFVVYRDFQELIGLIEKYLADNKQREHIAAAGRKAVLLHHTYVHRMRGILSEISRRFDMHSVPVENH